MLAYIYSLAAVMLLMWGAGSAVGPALLHLAAIAVGFVMIGLLTDYAIGKVDELNLADMRLHANKTFWNFERESYRNAMRQLTEANEELGRRLSALEDAATMEQMTEGAWSREEDAGVAEVV